MDNFWTQVSWGDGRVQKKQSEKKKTAGGINWDTDGCIFANEANKGASADQCREEEPKS